MSSEYSATAMVGTGTHKVDSVDTLTMTFDFEDKNQSKECHQKQTGGKTFTAMANTGTYFMSRVRAYRC